MKLLNTHIPLHPSPHSLFPITYRSFVALFPISYYLSVARRSVAFVAFRRFIRNTFAAYVRPLRGRYIALPIRCYRRWTPNGVCDRFLIVAFVARHHYPSPLSFALRPISYYLFPIPYFLFPIPYRSFVPPSLSRSVAFLTPPPKSN